MVNDLELMNEDVIYLKGNLLRVEKLLTRLLESCEFEKMISELEKTNDKIDDYMKNADKLNAMINELKGCVSIARSTMRDRQEWRRKVAELIRVIYQDL